MSRCLACSQENCGRLSPPCDCSCHPTRVPARTHTDDLTSKILEDYSWKAQKEKTLHDFNVRYFTELLETCGANLSRMERVSGLSRRHIRTLLQQVNLYDRVIDERISELQRSKRNVNEVAALVDPLDALRDAAGEEPPLP